MQANKQTEPSRPRVSGKLGTCAGSTAVPGWQKAIVMCVCMLHPCCLLALLPVAWFFFPVTRNNAFCSVAFETLAMLLFGRKCKRCPPTTRHNKCRLFIKCCHVTDAR